VSARETSAPRLILCYFLVAEPESWRGVYTPLGQIAVSLGLALISEEPAATVSASEFEQPRSKPCRSAGDLLGLSRYRGPAAIRSRSRVTKPSCLDSV
jgi:hypothetical protein